MTIVMFALSVTIYEIFANKINYRKCDLENKDKLLSHLPDLKHCRMKYVHERILKLFVMGFLLVVVLYLGTHVPPTRCLLTW